MAKSDAGETESDVAGRKGKTKADETADIRWMDPGSLKIKTEFQRLIPLQAKGELMALEDSIKEEGVRDPLLIWQGHNTVLDGHTRRELAIKHKKQVKVREIELADDKAAVEYVLKIQRERRNLTREAMSYFRGAEYNAVKQERGGSRPGRKSKGQSDPLTSTAGLLSQKYGVSEKTIKRDAIFAKTVDKIVEEYPDPDLRRKLLGADVRLSQGLAGKLLKMTSAKRKSMIDRLLAEGELPRSTEGEKVSARKPKEVAQDIVSRLQKKGEAHARAVLQQMARLLGMEIPTKTESD